MIVGLTGGISSGKTTVAKRLSQHGIEVIYADQISRDVVEPGQPALRQIADHFGSDVLLENGALNRAWLRQRIFNNASDKQWLESVLHPLIADETVIQLQAAQSPYAVLESPLLIEMGQDSWCDRILVIDLSEQLQIERGTKRDNTSPAEIAKIIASQAAREERRAKADDVILNDTTLENLVQATDVLHEKYLEMVAG